MTILVAIALGIVALGFVLFPFYRSVLATILGRRKATGTSSVQQAEAVDAGVASVTSVIGEREQAARDALQEVELDYQLGNISEEDYNILRERYVRRALVALKSRYEQHSDSIKSANRVDSVNNEDDQVLDEYATPDNDHDDRHIDEIIEEELRRLRAQRKPQVSEVTDSLAPVNESQEQGNKKNDAGN